jgi:D-galactarolactone cycloisomerase
MKITSVETVPLRWTMPYAVTLARGSYAEREALLVRIGTDEGLVGWGEAALWGGPPEVSQAVIEKEIFPLIEGLDPLRPEYLWELVYQQTYYHGRKGILMACLSGVDIALWDIVGKAAGQPLWRILGGFGRPVETYASSGYYRADRSMDDFAAEIASWIGKGYRGFKMKIGNTPDVIHDALTGPVPLRRSFEDDIARISVAREAVGQAALFVDANTSLDAAQAMRYADRLEALDVRWFEEPVQPENIDGCVRLAKRTRIPIAGFETETNKFTFKHLMDAGAIQMVQPDVVQVGGITEARKIAAYAQMCHLPFTSKNYSTAISQAAALSLLYAIPNGRWFEREIDPLPWREEFIRQPVYHLEDGYAQPSDRPGLGLNIDEEALRQWRTDL